MNVRYQSITFFSVKDKRLVRNLVRLRDPFIAKRVRSLIFEPTFAAQIYAQKKWVVPLNSPLRMRNARGYFQGGLSPDDLIREIASIVRDLSGITELTIRSDFRIISPLIAASFASSRTSLLKLKLSLPYNFIGKLVPLTVMFTKIRHFDVTLEEQYSRRMNPTPRPVLKHLATFITNHANTLQSVGLFLPEPRDPEETFDPVLEALGSISHLRSLRMALPIDSIPAPKLQSMVESIASSLRDLCLRTEPLSPVESNALAWIRRDLPHCSLPNLRTLVVGRSLLPRRFSRAVQWIQSFYTITKLDLRDDVPVRIYKHDCQTLVQSLSSRSTIKCLRLEVPLLDFHLVAQLASKFDGLQWLYLTFWHVDLHTEEKGQGQEEVIDNQFAYFRKDLDEEALAKWNLRHLRLASPSYSRKVVKMYANSLAGYLPKLESWTSFGLQQLRLD